MVSVPEPEPTLTKKHALPCGGGGTRRDWSPLPPPLAPRGGGGGLGPGPGYPPHRGGVLAETPAPPLQGGTGPPPLRGGVLAESRGPGAYVPSTPLRVALDRTLSD